MNELQRVKNLLTAKTPRDKLDTLQFSVGLLNAYSLYLEIQSI